MSSSETGRGATFTLILGYVSAGLVLFSATGVFDRGIQDAALVFGIVGLLVSFTFVTSAFSANRATTGQFLVAGAVIVFTVIGHFLMPRAHRVRVHRGATPNVINLKTIGIAMRAYQDANGTLPAPAVYDKAGTPLLSWRVLLLPVLEQGELFQQFRLDLPWNSSHNLSLLSKMPKVYAHPNRPSDAAQFKTNYLALVGKEAAFEEHKAFHLPKDFPDGISNTILIAESSIAVPWTKPEDLPYAPDKPLPPMGGLNRSFSVVLGDASVRFVSESISEKTLRAAITRNGNEELGPDW